MNNICMCVYIYMLFITLGDGPMVPSSGPASQPIGLFNLCATELSRMLLTLCAPRWPRAPGPSRAPIEPMQPYTLNHFRGSLSHFDKLSAIFQFWSVILLHYYYSAQSFLLQCSIILATVIGHFIELVIPRCYSAQLFSLRYSAQPFFTELQCSAILVNSTILCTTDGAV
jgi:hypothetical protein